jgi:hypothetical protein
MATAPMSQHRALGAEALILKKRGKGRVTHQLRVGRLCFVAAGRLPGMFPGSPSLRRQGALHQTSFKFL